MTEKMTATERLRQLLDERGVEADGRGGQVGRGALLDYTGRSAAREATENGNMDN